MAKLDLAAECKKILNEYADDLAKNVDEVTKAIGKKGAAALRDASRATFGGTGKYASGWSSEEEKRPLHSKAIIYNKKAPGLAHLLENGHASPNGGRVPGRAHIAPVEEQLIKEYEEAIKDAIKSN